jgi:hypothetical protein
MTSAEKLAARTQAEQRCEPILAWPKVDLALLVHLLAKAGWTQAAARLELERAGWWFP